MAVTSVWAVKVRMDAAIDYIENPEKTTLRPELEADASAARQAICNVIDYASDEDKTDQMMFVTGVNCDPNTAYKEFMEVKEYWHKEGGRLAYHGYQAFLEGPGEITAEEAHEIGVELAKELWGDRFQVVVATHLNTGHYHNHFVLNSVSFADGYKFYRMNSDYRKMQEISDRLCSERGLNVIRDKSPARGKSYAEWKAEREGKYTVRGRICEDIDYAVALSRSWDDFTEIMTGLGYEFKYFGKDGQELAHPGLKPPGAKGYFRYEGLGKNYDPWKLKERIIQNTVIPGYLPIPQYKPQVKNWEPSLEPMSGLPKLYRRYCYRLYCYVSRSNRKREYIPMAIREDIAKLDRYIEQLDFMYKHQVESKDSIPQLRAYYVSHLEELQERRKELYSIKNLAKKDNNTVHISSLNERIGELTDQIKEARHKIKLCDDCFVDCDRIAENDKLPDRNPKFAKQQKSRSGWAR